MNNDIEKTATVRDALRLAYKALMGGPLSCRYHDGDFDKSGMWMGEPRCDSCKQPARIAAALVAVQAAIEAEPNARVEQQWAVWFGGADANNAAEVMVRDDEADAREFLQWVDGDQGAGVAVRDLVISQWRAIEEAS